MVLRSTRRALSRTENAGKQLTCFCSSYYYEAMIRILASLVLWASVAGLMPAQDLKLIPWPRSVERGQGELVLRAPVQTKLASNSKEDSFAVDLLTEELGTFHQFEAGSAADQRTDILIGRPGNPEIDAEIARRKLDLTACDDPEGYVLDVNASGVLLVGKTAEGVFYGVQTLGQLVTANGRIPAVRISDWPALRYRALSIDINRGPILTEDQLQLTIRSMAEYKMNMLFLYMEHVFQYSHSRVATPPGGEVSPELIRRLSALARAYHVELVPHQQLFGHLHNFLKFERFAEMAEIPHGSVLSPASEQTYDWIRQATTELTSAFTGPFLLVGADETWELGEGRSRDLAKGAGPGGLYLKHLERVTGMLRASGKRLLFPGDIALKYPDIIPKLPKGLIAVTWAYSPKDDYSSYIEPFRKAGMEFFVCTTVHNWDRVFPNFADTRENVNNFTRDGKNSGALGLMATHWADDGEALFNMTWYGNVFSAAAAWQPGLVDPRSFDRSFDWAFYRNPDDQTFANAIRNLYQVHELLKAAGAGEANDNLFWVDPFSRHGAEEIRKAAPVASRLRILAEQAFVDLVTNEAKAKHHRHTIPFLEFAAKRMDYMGMKIQFATTVGEMYRAVLADPADSNKARQNLRRIRGMDGLLPSLRDYINEVKALYRDVWLSENRPYWLDNVLVRYENEALYWVQKMQLFDNAAEDYWATKSLPGPDKLGLFLP